MERLSVSALTEKVAGLLEGQLAELCVEGEVSGFKLHSSGHWYFSLKDAQAVVACAMFRGDNQRLRRTPREGEKVVVWGGLSVYPPRGSYSLVVRRIEAAGMGELQRRLWELRQKLAAEGLFDPARKRRLPAFPTAVGIATSPTGAALQDILRVVRQRFPGMPLYLAPCRVQGEGAAEEVARAIELLNRHGKAGVLIVGRGGGSAEDLWAFQEEVVVRAVAASRIPTVSAVGHEVDVSLCDLAADVRAATPSHAAELVTPVRAELLATVDALRDRLVHALQRRVRVLRDRVTRTRLLHPRQALARARMRCDELDDRLVGAMQRRMNIAHERVARQRVPELGLRVLWLRMRVEELEARLGPAVSRLVARRRERLRAGARGLDALSPLAVLDRGYSIARVGERVLRSVTMVAPGDRVEVQVADGSLATEVRAVRGRS